MKNLFKAILVIITISISASCIKISTRKNIINIEDEKHKISQAFIENYGVYNEADDYGLAIWEGNKIYIDFVCKDLEVNDSNMAYVSGEGLFFEFKLFSEDPDIKSGDYAFDSESLKLNTISYSAYGYINNYNQIEYYKKNVSGSLTVNKEDDIYEITFTCMNEADSLLTGYYKGELTFIDRQDQKSEPLSKRFFENTNE